MLDLIRFAYGFTPDKIIGGPSWLEMDRYDVIAKVPSGSTPETEKLMLQALLEDRFKLVIRKDTKPVPTYALTAGKKPSMKEGDGSGDTGCRMRSAEGQGENGALGTIENGVQTMIRLGPGATVQFQCRNITMEAFAAGLTRMIGNSLGTHPVIDQTGLKGNWNFDVRWSLQGGLGNSGERITPSQAIEKIGLKLEEKQSPMPAIVVESVNEKPTENPPGVAEALPAVPLPTEFEVADVKLSDSGPQNGPRMGTFNMQPGGRFTATFMTLRFLLARAFNTSVSGNDQIAGLPDFVDTTKFDITAKTATAPGIAALDTESLAPLLRSLLADRFKMKYHTEERMVAAYSLVQAKPKMKKADPASRTSCKLADAPPGAPPGSRSLVCQNITMAQFADRLQNAAPGFTWPVLDATGIEGGWDFTLTFSMFAMLNGPGRSENAGLPSDPNGSYTIFEAIEKQIGLKLEARKRSEPVVVIDHIEPKPTDN